MRFRPEPEFSELEVKIRPEPEFLAGLFCMNHELDTRVRGKAGARPRAKAMRAYEHTVICSN